MARQIQFRRPTSNVPPSWRSWRRGLLVAVRYVYGVCIYIMDFENKKNLLRDLKVENSDAKLLASPSGPTYPYGRFKFRIATRKCGCLINKNRPIMTNIYK